MEGDSVVSSAPGKVILFGEHAVVYGYPAIAAPVMDIKATVVVETLPDSQPPGLIRIEAPDIGLISNLQDLSLDHPLSLAIRGVLAYLKISEPPAMCIKISSSIPVAAGLGSGAAVSVAIIRALSCFFHASLQPEIISALAYEVEKRYHGRPSGIDNTVITYAQPIFFQREKPFEVFTLSYPLTLVIADTGIASPTAAAVSGVRDRFECNPAEYRPLFEAIGRIAARAREVFEHGSIAEIGDLMDRNHHLLQKIGVSCGELDRLAQAAHQAGALGAKLSGAGLGGNMIALAENAVGAEKISSALLAAGSRRCFVATIPADRGRLS